MSEELGTIEERAKRMGHVSKEEFRGDPDKWVDAQTFVDRAENQLPIMKGTLTAMEKKMVEQETLIRKLVDDNEKIKQSTEQFVEFSKKAEERAYKKAVAELQAKQRAAVESANTEEFDKATAELDQMLKEHPAVTGKQAEVKPAEAKPAEAENKWLQPGVFEAWKDENDWYSKKPKMYAYAVQMDSFLAQNQPALSQKDRLAEITKLVKEEFPEYWENPRRKAAAVEGSETGATGPGSNGKHSYADLPPTAKAMCDEWAGKDGKGTGTLGPKFTREQYLASYQWDD